MFRFTPFLLVFAALLTATAALSQPISLLVTQPKLTIMPGDNTVVTAIGTASWSSADMRAGPQAELTHEFVVKNETGAPITVDHISTACDCTTAVLTGATQSQPPFVVNPGQQFGVRVTVSTEHLAPGPFSKQAWLYGPGEVTLAALTTSGRLEPTVSATPSTADFGKIVFESHRTVVLFVTIKRDLVPDGATVVMVPTGPTFTVGHGRELSSPDLKTLRFRYLVGISPHAPLGPVSELLDLRFRYPDGTELPIPDGAISAIANVIGNLRVDPAVVDFQILKPGTRATKRIQILCSDAHLSKGLRILNTRRAIGVALSNGGKTSVRTIAVTAPKLKNDELLNTSFTVVAPDGESIVVPVYGIASNHE